MKIPIYRVGMDGSFYCDENLTSAINELENLAREGVPGESYELSIIEMTREEYENLEEFGGW